MFVEDNPLVNEQGRIGQCCGDGGASYAQQGNQNESGNKGYRKANQRGVEVVFGFARA